MLISISKDGMSKLSRKAFLILSNKEQKVYLKTFPDSTHRELLKKKVDKPKKKKGDKQLGKPKKNKNKIAKITREEFDELSKKEQKKYNKVHSGPKAFKGKKHFITKKPSFGIKKDTKGEVGSGDMSIDDHIRAEKRTIKEYKNDVKKSFKNSITRESVKALNNITPKDIADAVSTLKRDKHKNVPNLLKTLDDQSIYANIKPGDLDIFDSRLLDQRNKGKESDFSPEEMDKLNKMRGSWKEGVNKLDPEDLDTYDRLVENSPNDGPFKRERKAVNKWRKNMMFRRDLDAIGKIFKGSEIEPGGRTNLVLSVAMVTRYALLGSAVFALTVGAGPAALVIAQGLHESWDELNVSKRGDKRRRNKFDQKQYAIRERKRKERQEEERKRLGLENDDDKPKDGAGSWGKFTASASSESDGLIMSLLYDSIVDHIDNLDVDEFKQDVSDNFSQFVSTSSDDTIRVIYKSSAKERYKPSALKTRISIHVDDVSIGHLYRENDLWCAVLTSKFNPLDFPHYDEEDEDTTEEYEPYVLTNDIKGEEDLELHYTKGSSLSSIKTFVNNIING